MIRLRTLALILLLLWPAIAFCDEKQPVEILIFYAQGCKPCQDVREQVIPLLEIKYGDKIKIQELDFHKPENYFKLIELQDKYNWHPEENVTPTLFIDGKFLEGKKEINIYLSLYIDTALSKGGQAIPVSPVSTVDLEARFKLFTPLAVFTAGLIDGVNPCAFTVIIFFISFLSLQGYSRRKILAIGISFILAVFLTYVFIGFELFNFLFRLKAYWVIVKVLYILGALLCFSLAGFAFYDFVKFRKTSKTQDLVLQFVLIS